MEDNKELTIKEETRAVAPVSDKTIGDYLVAFGLANELTKAEQQQFIEVAKAFQLNPFKREIYCVPHVNQDGKRTLSIITGYETYLKRAEANPNYDGFTTEFGIDGNNVVCTCKVYRKDRKMPVTSNVFMNEYNTGKSLWKTKPKTMLEKVAIATAFRRAFPTDFGGMPYTQDELPEEMTQPQMRDVSPAPNSSEIPNSSPEPVQEAPQKVKATPEQIDEMAKLAKDFTEQELAEFRAKYIGYPDKMITAMREARIRKFEAGTLRQETPEQKKYPWATPEQSAELERLEKEGQEQKKETVGEPAAPLFPDDSKELYK